MSDVVVVVEGSDTSVTVTETSVNVDVTVTDATVTISDAGPQGSSYPLGGPIYSKVRNATGATLTKGTIVYTSGANGDNVQVTKAQANADVTSARTMGFVADDILNGTDGYVIISGYITGLDTDGTTAGQIAYLSPTVAGAWTTTKPKAPNHLVYVGVITRVNANNGSIFVHPQNGYELDEIHDVLITTPTDNQVLTYESASGLWKNKTNTVDGVQSVVFASPLTGGTVTSSGTVGLDQSALSITASQVSGTAVITSDSRLSDSRTPTAHASTHASAGSDPVTLAQSQITNLTTDLALKAALTASQTFTGTQTLIPASSSTVPVIIQGAASQTANHLTVQNSGGGFLAGILSNGGIRMQQARINTASALGTLSAVAESSTTVGAVIRGAASQSANLTEWQDSTGGVLSQINSSGQFGTSRLSVSPNASISTASRFFVSASSATDIGAIIRGAASQSANLLEIQDSAAGQLAYISSGGTIYNAGRLIVRSDYSATLNVGQATASQVGFVIRGAASQTADFTQWQNSSGSTIVSVGSDGRIVTNGGVAAASWLRVGSTTASLGGGAGLIAMANAITVPTSSPTGGGVLYAEGGALKWRGSSGTITTIAAA